MIAELERDRLHLIEKDESGTLKEMRKIGKAILDGEYKGGRRSASISERDGCCENRLEMWSDQESKKKSKKKRAAGVDGGLGDSQEVSVAEDTGAEDPDAHSDKSYDKCHQNVSSETSS